MAEAGMLVYQVLDPPGNAIRLLTLLPGSFSDDIYLSITHENLQDDKYTPYECLSYTWASAEQGQERVYIWQTSSADGSDVVDSLQFLDIRKHLLTALRYIRLPDTPQVTWIDAICINQANIVEKGREVARMGQIYNNAAQVLVWLGQEDKGTPMALDMIERLSSGVVLTWDHRNCDTIPGSEAEMVERHIDRSNLTHQHWLSLSNFIQRPWFKRLWIRQEVQMASKVLVKCGFSEIEWAKIEKMIIFVEHKASGADLDLKDILFCRSLFPYVGSDSLIYTLHRSSLCGHHDHRDLIYANLSTSQAMKALQIKPDYAATDSHVFKDMTCKHIQRFKSLELLRLCDLPSLPPGFQSFVPNFAMAKSEARLFSVYAHAGSRQSYVDIVGGNINVKGRIAAKIRKVSPFQKPVAIKTLNGDNHIDVVRTYHQWEPERSWSL